MAKKPEASPRDLAVQLLLQVLDKGASLSTALESDPRLARLEPRDRGFVQYLVYGVLRQYHQLHVLLQQLLEKPLKHKDEDIRLILLLALFQLQSSRVPDYACVDAAVSQTRAGKKRWAAGLVNGVLRNFLRQKDALLEQIVMDESARWCHPDWLIERIRQDWPADLESILTENNAQAPMILRVNTAQVSMAQRLEQLPESQPVGPQAIQLATPRDVLDLPGFAEGRLSVQDAGAQKAAQLLVCQTGDRVLDACAAPGGKTGHLLELYEGIHVDAMDVSAERLQRVQQNLERLHLSARLLQGDATDLDWWDGKTYDGILLDVPCSATGVIRRHPDIKLHRRAEDIEALVQTQQAILDNVWQTLRPGGQLLYVTCSILRLENQRNVSRFLQQHADAEHMPIEADWGRECEFGRQLLPGEAGMDGFYYAWLKKSLA